MQCLPHPPAPVAPGGSLAGGGGGGSGHLPDPEGLLTSSNKAWQALSTWIWVGLSPVAAQGRGWGQRQGSRVLMWAKHGGLQGQWAAIQSRSLFWSIGLETVGRLPWRDRDHQRNKGQRSSGDPRCHPLQSRVASLPGLLPGLCTSPLQPVPFLMSSLKKAMPLPPAWL